MNSINNEIEQKSVTIEVKVRMPSIHETFFRYRNKVYKELHETITEAKPSTLYVICWDE